MHDGTKAAAQIQAFEDTWEWNADSARAYQQVVERGGDVSKAMQAFRVLLGASDMLAYLSMMAERLIELHRVLKPSGSIFLHCDPTASHYLKLLLDSIFGPTNSCNEIVWSYPSMDRPEQTAAAPPRRDLLVCQGIRPTYVQHGLGDAREC